MRTCLAILAVLGIATPSAEAALTPWTIQSASSSLTISGALSSGGFFLNGLRSQAPGGGLTTTLGGTISTTEGPNAIIGIPPEYLVINSANITTNPSGNWDPLPGGNTGQAPAAFGGYIDLVGLGILDVAIRSLSANLNSGILPLSGNPFSPQTFAGNIDLLLSAGSMDYRGVGIIASALGRGTIADGIAGETATILGGTITLSPTVSTLVIPIAFNFSASITGADTTDVLDDAEFHFSLTGNVTATAVVPEASSLVLLGLAVSAISFVSYRQKRSNV